jgi:hypothetical protein
MGEKRSSGGAGRALGEVDRKHDRQTQGNHTPEMTMFASTSEIRSRGPRGPRRNRGDRRTRTNLRELCDEVLASYRVARGEDVISEEDRRSAEELLKAVTPLKR